MNRFAKGVLLALLGASLWGFSGGCAQFLLSNYDISAFFITVLRMPLGGLVLLGAVALTQKGKLTAMVRDRSSWAPLALFGILGLMASQIAYLLCIQQTNAGTATVLQALSTVMVMLWVCVTTPRWPRLGEAIALVCALAATVLISTAGDLTTLSLPPLALVWGLLNALTVAFYLIQPLKLFEKWGSLPVTGAAMFIGGVTALAIWLLLQIPAGVSPDIATLVSLPHLDAVGWLVFAILTLVGTCAAYGLYLAGVAAVGSVPGSLIGSAEPVSATLFSVFWLGTVFTWADWVGLVLMVITIVLVALQPEKCDESPRPPTSSEAE